MILELSDNVSADGQRCCRRWAGCIEYVQGIGAADNVKVFHQSAFGSHRLRANTGATGFEIVRANGGHEAL